MSWLVCWLILSATVWLTSKLMPGFELREGFSNALIVAAMFGVLNATLGYLLFHIIGISTLFIGYMLAFVTRTLVSAAVLMLVDKLTDRLHIDGCVTALFASVVVGISGAFSDLVVT